MTFAITPPPLCKDRGTRGERGIAPALFLHGGLTAVTPHLPDLKILCRAWKAYQVWESQGQFTVPRGDDQVGG